MCYNDNMYERLIFHVDVNSAFLSWEAVEHLNNGGTEDYRNMLVAVGGDVQTRHGIIVAKSILTKPYGIETGEPVVNALRKCPRLKLIPPHIEIYRRYSKALMNILHQYSDFVEQFSIDEAFLDMSESIKILGTPVEVADRIRRQVSEELGFTVNVGVASNKLLAKMASDFTKPDKTHTLFAGEIQKKMWPLPVRELFFVGTNSAKALNSIGIRTIGELAATDVETLVRHFKKHGEYMWRAANGIDDSEVVTQREDPKGYSHETTVSYDITDANEAKMILRDLTEKVAQRIRKDQVKITIVDVLFRFNDLSRASKQCKIPTATNITDEIYRYVCRLFDEKWDGTPIRLLGVRVSGVAEESFRQLSLFDNTDYEKLEKLDQVLDEINSKFGKGAIKRASVLEENSDK